MPPSGYMVYGIPDLNQTTEYLRLESEPFSKTSYHAEIMQYVLHQQIGRLTVFFFMIFNLLLFIGAFIRYQNSKTYIIIFFIVFLYYLLLVFY